MSKKKFNLQLDVSLTTSQDLYDQLKNNDNNNNKDNSEKKNSNQNNKSLFEKKKDKNLIYTSMEIGLEDVIFKEKNSDDSLIVGAHGIKKSSSLLNDFFMIEENDLEIEGMLGNGASGSVRKAIFKPKNIPMAIKSINIYDETKRKQFKNDITVLKDNKCKFLVHFYQAFFQEGNIKILLEYMDLGSLENILQKLKTNKYQNFIPEIILSKIVQQILQGLLYLHKKMKQIHRDIKPANILINSKGLVKLTDFGISKKLEKNNDYSSTFVGTKNFMSPERIMGKNHSFSSDIWSLGLVIYELATGSFPYLIDNNFLMQITRIVEGPIPVIPENEKYSPELRDFVSRCLQKDPKYRDTVIELMNHPFILNNDLKDYELIEWLNNFYNDIKI